MKLQSRKVILYENRDDFAIFAVFEGKKGSLCEWKHWDEEKFSREFFLISVFLSAHLGWMTCKKWIITFIKVQKWRKEKENMIKKEEVIAW